VLPKSNRTFAISLALIFAYAAFALFWNLGDRSLWGDEAETAVLAVNITKTGLPYATDGKNYVTLLGAGKDTNASDIWVWSPWLDEYLAAASFAILGKTTFAARFPFAVAGFAAVLYFPLLAQRLFRNREATLVATLLFATSTPLILHIRQCRYYAVILLAQLILVHGYEAVAKDRRRAGIAALVAALVVQWYCNYILAVCNAAALGIVIALQRKSNPKLARSLGVTLGICAVLCLPWLLYARPGAQSELLGFAGIGKRIGFYGKYALLYIGPSLVCAALPAMLAKKGDRQPEPLTRRDGPGFYQLVLALCIAHFAVLLITPGYYYRYLIPLVPVFLLVLARTISIIEPRNLRYAAIAIVFAALNLVSMTRLLQDITAPYRNAVDDIVAYLNEHASPGDTVFVQDPALPLIFYTDLQYIDGRLHRNLDMKNLPRWILSRDAGSVLQGTLLKLPPALQPHYESVELPVHASPKGDSRPDPDFHQWAAAKEMTEYIIYKRKD